MADESGQSGIRERITRQGEDALGKLAQELLENPVVNSASARRRRRRPPWGRSTSRRRPTSSG